MSKFTLDVDDSSASMVEMTEAEMGVFSTLRKSDTKTKKQKSKSRSRSKNNSKSAIKLKKKSKGKINGKGKKVTPTKVNKKKQRKQSSSSSQQLKEVKPKKQRRKVEPYVPQTPEQRFAKQIKEVQLVKYGNAKFVKNGTKSPVLSYSSKAKQTLRTGVTWWISNGQYSDQNWTRIFQDMYEIQVRDLRISNNNYPNIIRQLHHVRFDNIQILNLHENNISSIELLSRMRLPQLKDFSLRNNKITSLRSMCKMSLKNLVTFSVADNYILRMDRFYYINTQSLEEIFLQWKGSAVISEDMSWMAKLKKNPKLTKVNCYMQKVLVQSKNRIAQRTVDQALMNKYRKPHLIKRKLT